MGRHFDGSCHRVLACLAAFLCILGNACVRLEYGGRDHLRIAPLKDAVTLPGAWSSQPISIDAGTDALSDEELAPLSQYLNKRVQREAAALQDAKPHFARGPGLGIIRSCQLRAGAGRRNTVYKANCRALWVIGDVVVAEARGDATLLAPARAVTRRQAEEIARQVRNPLLSAADARRVLEEASVHSMHQLVGWPAPGCGHALPVRQSEKVSVPDKAVQLLRQRARRDLSSPHLIVKRAAISDLMRYGRPEDAAFLHGFLDSNVPDLRRAAALALSELAWGKSLPALQAHRNDTDEETRRFIQLGIARIRAFYGFAGEEGLSAPPVERAFEPDTDARESSKSSTPGGRDTGSIPTSVR